MRIAARSRSRRRRGSVLVLSLVAVGVVAILSIACLHLSATVTRRQVSSVDSKIAFYLAEAGLTEAYTGLAAGRTGNVGSATSPAVMGEGLVWVEAEEFDGDQVRLTSTAHAKSGQAVLGMVVRRGRANGGSLGLFSETDLLIPAGAQIDGFNSSLGSYEEQARSDPAGLEKGRVGSNSDILVVGGADSTQVRGDVFSGPAGMVSTDGEPTITGSLGQRFALATLDAVEVPTVSMLNGHAQPAGPPMVVPSGNIGAQYLHVNPDAEVVFSGPLRLVLNGLRLARGAEVTFDTSNGPVLLWVSDYLELDPASVLTNTSEDASSVTISVAGDAEVNLASSGAFHALINAPEATVRVGAGFELFGGLVAEHLDLAEGVRLHYDVNLGVVGAEEALPTLVSWRIIEMPAGAPGSLAADPFRRFKVDPDTAPGLASAHEDQWVRCEYEDRDGGVKTYEGEESRFDWTRVRRVRDMRRGEKKVNPGLAAPGRRISRIRRAR